MNRKRLCAYAAGIFDGEGSLGINRFHQGVQRQVYYAEKASVGMCDRAPLDIMHALWGGIVRQEKQRGYVRTPFRWQISGEPLRQMLLEIKPYLIVRRGEAVALINFREKREEIWTDAGWGGRGDRLRGKKRVVKRRSSEITEAFEEFQRAKERRLKNGSKPYVKTAEIRRGVSH